MSQQTPLESDNSKVSTVECPSCKTQVRWLEENAFRPFCSESCKNKDFIGWANEEKRVAGSSNYDDIFSGDLGQDLDSSN